MRDRLPMWVPGAAVAAALIALVSWSFWQRWQLVTASPFPIGVDGYFYPIELRSLLAHGHLAYPASPLTLYLLAPLAAATDPITGTKLGAAVYGAAIALPAYGIGARLGGGRGAGLVAAVLATTSVGSAYLTIEFVKNGIGLTVALTALWLVLVAAERPTRRWIAAAIAGLVAAWAAHKMAAALVAVVAVPAGIAAATAHGRLRGRRLLYLVGALLAAGVVAIVIGAMFPRRFLSVDDATLAHGLWSSTPRWTAPALVFPSGELTVGHDALIGEVIALAALAILILRKLLATAAVAEGRPPNAVAATEGRPPNAAAEGRPANAAPAAEGRRALPASDAVAAWPILLLAIAIGLPFLAVTDRQGLGFRLRIAAFVPAALSAAILVRAVFHAPPGRASPAAIIARAVIGTGTQRLAGIRWAGFSLLDGGLAALAIALAVLRQPGSQLDGEVVTHPALVSAAQGLRGQIPLGVTLIVPERHIAFLVAWYTGAPVAIGPEGVPPEARYRLLPLHFIGAGSSLDRALIAARAEPSLVPPLGMHPRHPDGLVLVAEATWRWALAQLPPADRAHYAAWPTL